MADRRAELARITRDFIDTYERRDLGAMIQFLAVDAVYHQFNGTRTSGVEAIREVFRPQFEGAFGEMSFTDEDLFVDASSGKVTWRWRCTLEVNGAPTAWRGISLLDWNSDDRITRLRTYAKTRVPKFET